MGARLKNVRIRSAIGASLFGITRQAVLRLFFTHPDERFYQRQIVQLLELGSGGVQRELEGLTKAGILTKLVEGRQTYFHVNKENAAFDELQGLIRKTFGVPRIVETCLRPLAKQIRLAFIYGSFASGKETAQSDVDLMIVGDNISLDDVVPVLADAQRELRREMNPTVYNSDEFARKLAEKSHFVSQVVAGTKIFVIGTENDISKLAEKRLAKAAPKQRTRNQRPAKRR
mgnify:CR=1 FL=1